MGLILKHVYNSSKINEIISNGFSSYKAAWILVKIETITKNNNHIHYKY
jgi:hypothetical protein